MGDSPWLHSCAIKNKGGDRVTVIEKKPVPVYESICPECKSVFWYKAVEVSRMHISCPVCGVSMLASQVPVGVEKAE